MKIINLLSLLLIFNVINYSQSSITFISQEGEIAQDILIFADNFHYAKAIQLLETTFATDTAFNNKLTETEYQIISPFTPKFWQDKRKDWNGAISMKVKFNNPGKYYLRLKLRATSQDNEKNDVARYWVIAVTKPVLVAPFTFKNKFYFRENFSFSFAVDGKEYGSFSYKVIDDASGATKESGKGAFVNLSKILNDPVNVNKKMTIQGFYKDKLLDYYLNYNDKEAKKASWSFTISAPVLNLINDFWIEKDSFKVETAPLVDLTLKTKNTPLDFKYVYISYDRENDFSLFTSPEISDVKVTSKIAGFLMGARPYEVSKAGITVKVNPDYLKTILPGEKRIVDIFLSFTTQFGEHEQEYRAVLIRPFGIK